MLAGAGTNVDYGTQLRDAAATGRVVDVHLLSLAEEVVDGVIPNVDLPDPSNGKTALHLAVEGQHYETVDVLMNTYHAKPTVKAFGGLTPGHLAVKALKKASTSAAATAASNILSLLYLQHKPLPAETLDLLTEPSDAGLSVRAMLEQIATGEMEVAHPKAKALALEFLNAALDVGRVLRLAAASGHPESVMAILTKHPGLVEAKGPETGQTPLHRAVAGRRDIPFDRSFMRTQIIGFLIEHFHADITAVDKAGNTAGHHAALALTQTANPMLIALQLSILQILYLPVPEPDSAAHAMLMGLTISSRRIEDPARLALLNQTNAAGKSTKRMLQEIAQSETSVAARAAKVFLANHLGENPDGSAIPPEAAAAHL